MLSVLVSLLDFSLSNDSPLSIYVTTVGVVVGFFPCQMIHLYLIYVIIAGVIVGVFSCQTIQLYLITLSLLDLFHSDSTFPLKPRHTPDIFFSKIENTSHLYPGRSMTVW